MEGKEVLGREGPVGTRHFDHILDAHVCTTLGAGLDPVYGKVGKGRVRIADRSVIIYGQLPVCNVYDALLGVIETVGRSEVFDDGHPLHPDVADGLQVIRVTYPDFYPVESVGYGDLPVGFLTAFG